MQKAQLVGNLESGLPFSDQSFDLILFGPSVSEYVPGKADAVTEMRKGLRPRGTAFVDLTAFAIEPDTATYFAKHEPDYRYFRDPLFKNSGLLAISNLNPDAATLDLEIVSIAAQQVGPTTIYLETYRHTILT